MRGVRHALVVAAAFAFAFALTACGGEVASLGRGVDGGGYSGTGGGSGNGGTGGGSGSNGTTSGLPTCATASHAAQRLPPSILLLVDASASMGLSLATGESRWGAAAKAITTMLDESPGDFRFGLRSFPSASGIGGVKCQAASYEALQVELGPRSTTRQPIACHVGAAIGNCTGIKPIELIIGTPINAAMRGAAARMVKEKGAGARVIVLVTDGMPIGCAPNTIGDITAAAKTAYSQHQVRTYVLSVDTTSGLFAGMRNANASLIAAAGGGKRKADCVDASPDAASSCAYHISDGNFRKDMEQALRDVAGKSLGCVFNLPTGANADPDKVNVVLERDGKRELIARDPAHENGWDYEPGGASVRLHGATCAAVEAEANASVTVELGCKTKRVL